MILYWVLGLHVGPGFHIDCMFSNYSMVCLYCFLLDLCSRSTMFYSCDRTANATNCLSASLWTSHQFANCKCKLAALMQPSLCVMNTLSNSMIVEGNWCRTEATLDCLSQFSKWSDRSNLLYIFTERRFKYASCAHFTISGVSYQDNKLLTKS